jgi:phage shock protein PspC (stress-responsive transcriptional regulator)
MNKVISINLNGNAYQLEEGGFEALRSYLDTANRRLEGNPDKAEIMADIEQAIADKFRSLLGVNKTVVVTKEVETIIAEMGTVEDASGSPGTPPPGSAAQPAGAPPGADSAPGAAAPPKRLFKIHEGAMVGGVCNGLAAYLNVDVTLVRIVFALLMFAYGSGVLVYILMMAILPTATTPAEMAAAHGSTSATAQEFIRRAREGYYEGMKTFGDKRAYREWKRKFKREMRNWKWDFHHDMQQTAHRWWPGWGPYVAPRNPTGSLLAATVLSILLVFATLAGLFAIVSLVSSGTVFGLMFFPSLPFWLRIVLLIAIISVIRCPLKHARRSLYYGHGYHDSGCWGLWCIVKWVLIVYFIIWLCGGHTGLGEAVQHLPPKLHHAADSMQQWWNQQ